MTPEERQEFNALKEMVRNLQQVTDVVFVENLKRRIITNLVVSDLPSIKLSDLSDVSDTDSASTGEVLKKTATTWQPGTDNIA